MRGQVSALPDMRETPSLTILEAISTLLGGVRPLRDRYAIVAEAVKAEKSIKRGKTVVVFFSGWASRELWRPMID